MKKKYVLFDVDGTLTDSQEGIMNSIEYALDYFGIRVEDRSTLRPWLGPPLRESMMKFYDFSHEDTLIGVEKYREYFDRQGIFENKVYPGVKDLLTKLTAQGYTLLTATSKPEAAAERIMDHFDLTPYFSFIGGASLDDSRVKKGDVIRYVLRENQLEDKSQVIMVGDREHDILGARENGLESIGVLYGYGSLPELQQAGANYVAETVKDVAKFL